MGGSGGSDHWRPPQATEGEQDQDDSCESLRFTTNLAPFEGAPRHEPGTVLSVVPTEVGAGTAFVAVDSDGQMVGTIVERIDSLRRCDARGFSYEAQVTQVTLGTHTVLVRAAGG